MDYVFKGNDIVKTFRKAGFKKFNALDGLNINVPKGAIYGLIGQNGAGKTTILRILSGVQIPSKGSFSLYDVSNKSGKIDKCRRRMGIFLSMPAMYDNTTVLGCLKYEYDLKGIKDNGNINETIEKFGLSNHEKTKVKKLSLGLKQRLGIAMAMCGNPDFVVLDEPMNGLDPETIIWLREYILEMNRKNDVTFLISSHMLEELSKIITHVGIIKEGKMIKEASVEEIEEKLKKSTRVQVSDITAFSKVCEEKGYQYEIIGDDTADLFEKISVNNLVSIFKEAGCEILELTENVESLESYYLEVNNGK